MRFALGSFVVLCTLLLAGGAAAADDDDVRYTVQPGDSLFGLSKRLLDNPARWTEVRRYNGIGSVTALRPGTVLRLRPDWFPSEPAQARLESVGGAASIDGVGAAVGAVMTEGALIETGRDGTAVVRLTDGTLLRIPPASRVRLERLRAFHGDESVEARIRLEQGSVEPASAPKRKRRLEVRTPAGNAAVRGTEFRVRTEGRDDFVEVLAGAVDAGSPAGRAGVDGGNGAVVNASRAPWVERLLAAPDLRSFQDRPFTVIAPRLELPAVAAAAGYRVDIANDPAFVDLLLSSRIATPEVTVPTRRDGPLYLRLLGVSAAGLDGFPAVARIDIRARPVAPRPIAPAAHDAVLAGDVECRWVPDRPGLSYRVQLADDERFLRLLAETVVSGDTARLALPPGPAGRRWWRVAAIEADGAGAERQGPFSEAQPFEQRAPAPIERAPRPPVLRDSTGEPIRTGSGGVVVPGF